MQRDFIHNRIHLHTVVRRFGAVYVCSIDKRLLIAEPCKFDDGTLKFVNQLFINIDECNDGHKHPFNDTLDFMESHQCEQT